MSDYSIGISALDAARRGLEVTGNNIANAATEGYHRQRLELSPATSWREGDLLFGTGVDVSGVRRLVDSLLESELLRQNSLLSLVDRELSALRTVENALGELSTEEGGLNAAIDRFFGALQELSAHPQDEIRQNQVVSEADAMAGQFRAMGELLATLETQIRVETENVVDSINDLVAQIGELNADIQKSEIGGGVAADLRDHRDKLISDLAKLVGVETQARPYGVADVNAEGFPLVMGTVTMQLEVGLDANGQLGISPAGSAIYTTEMASGKLAGLLSLRNTLLADVHSRLDDLSCAMIQQINRYHVQGIGKAGSFTELTGWAMPDATVSQFSPPVTDGTVYVRVTNTSTGAVSRSAITIDASTDTLSSVAAKISDVSGLNGSVVSSMLRISADPGYEFDFLPAVLPAPTSSTLTGSPPTVSVSGIYTGTASDTFTFTVSGSGSVGNGTLNLVVTDSGGQTIATLNVGAGYAAGDTLELGNGIKIALTTGDLNDAETFTVDAFAETDTSGLLASVGINTFFSGNDAQDIAVSADILASPARVASAIGPDMTDNMNAERMAGVRDMAVSDLGSLTCGQFYRKLVTDIGQNISIKQIRQDNIEQMIQELSERQGQASGVDVNEEAAQLLVFERMFQAAAKYIATVQASLASLMTMF